MTHSLADEAVALDESRRSAQERLRDAEDEGRLDISGHTFRFRDEMEAHLRVTHRARVGRPLTGGEVGMVKCVAIALWADHAREHGVNVKIITHEHHQLVTRAQAQKEEQAAKALPLNLDGMRFNDAHRVLQRSLDVLLPGQTRHPENNRKLERRRS